MGSQGIKVSQGAMRTNNQGFLLFIRARKHDFKDDKRQDVPVQPVRIIVVLFESLDDVRDPDAVFFMGLEMDRAVDKSVSDRRLCDEHLCEQFGATCREDIIAGVEANGLSPVAEPFRLNARSPFEQDRVEPR